MAEKSVDTQKLPMSAMAITCLVIGICALVTSVIPIVNNGSFFLAIAGIIFGIVGVVGIMKGKKRSKVLAFVALGINVLAIIVTLACQSFYSSSFEKAMNGPTAVSSSEVKVGEAISFSNGLEVTVVSVEPGGKNYDGTALKKVTVTYKNNGSKEASYNSYDWKAEDPQGAQTSNTYSSQSGVTQLNSGTLAPGGTVTGVIFFKGEIAKMCYSSSFTTSGSSAT